MNTNEPDPEDDPFHQFVMPKDFLSRSASFIAKDRDNELKEDVL